MQVLQSTDNLRRIALDFQFVQSFTAFEQFVHTLVLAEFQKDIHTFTILEKVLEVTDVGMLDTPVNLDFTHKFLFGATFGQTRLQNDFGCVHKRGISIDEFVAFGKATLS